MSMRHEGEYGVSSTFENNEGQRSLSCRNEAPLRCPSLVSNNTLSQETLDSLDALGNVLRRVRKRMIVEGYEIRNGELHQTKS